MKSIEYDIDIAILHKHPDLCELEKFVASEHKTMAITYETNAECQKRRACLRTWLSKNEYRNVYLRVKNNILYVIKEQ